MAADDLAGWRESGHCRVRYQMTEVPAGPTGAMPRQLLGDLSMPHRGR